MGEIRRFGSGYRDPDRVVQGEVVQYCGGGGGVDLAGVRCEMDGVDQIGGGDEEHDPEHESGHDPILNRAHYCNGRPQFLRIAVS